MMATYAVTGSASGMGREVTRRLCAAGHEVIGIDREHADVVADLSTPRGRRSAVDGTLSRAPHGLDGAVLAAGVGPGAGRARSIVEVDFFGVVELLAGWRPALARTTASTVTSKVVVFGSNSATTTPLVPARTVRALLAGDAEGAVRTSCHYRALQPSILYGAAKLAVSRWVRRQAVTDAWVGAGIRLNVLAPGAVDTPLLAEQLSTPGQAKVIAAFPIPVGHHGDAGDLAEWALFMLSPASEFLCGSVVFVDGGSDAWLSGDDWPAAPRGAQVLRYLDRLRVWRARGWR